jgi:hypothetical protein
MGRWELLVKVGDSNGGRDERRNWLDGQVIAAQPPGFSVDARDFAAWIADPRATPPDYLLWTRFDRDVHTKRRDQIAYLTTPGLDPKAAAVIREDVPADDPIWDSDTGREWIAEAQRDIARAVSDAAYFSVNPYDLRWGVMDMREHGILIADVAEVDLIDFRESAIDRREHPYKRVPPEYRTRFRVAYEELLSPDTLRDWIDRRVSVYPPRHNPPFGGDFKQDVKDRPPPPERDARA